MRQLSHPFVSSLVVLGAFGIAGFVAWAVTWRAVAAEGAVVNQVPYLVSGGIGCGALIGFAFGVWVIQHRRLKEASWRADLGELTEAVAGLVVVAREKGGSR